MVCRTERLGVEQTEAVKPEQKMAETVTQAETISPAVKETPGQRLRREIERSRQRQQQQRRSGGIHM
jgi:hypothetical protein